MTAVLGDKELDRKLKQLGTKSSKKAITAGVRAGMTPIAKAMRAAINATDASKELKREARKTIGARFAKDKAGIDRGQKKAKVGFAVGKKRSKVKASGSGQSRGVGASSANIHWFVLGTDQRVTEAGRQTGRIAGVFDGVTDQAVARSSQASLAAARAKISQVIEREARKRA